MHSRYDTVIFLRGRVRHYRDGAVKSARKGGKLVSPQRMKDYCPRSSGAMYVLYALTDEDSPRVPCFKIEPDGTIIQNGDPYRYGTDPLYDLPVGVRNKTVAVEFALGGYKKVSKAQKEAAKALIDAIGGVGFRLVRDRIFYGPGVKAALGIDKPKQEATVIPDADEDTAFEAPKKTRKPRHRKTSTE